jgi:DNA-binding MarR family transcriptional regulator
VDWENYAFVLRGKIRLKVLLALNKPKTPTQLSKELRIGLVQISRALKELSDRNLVRCINPNDKIGRLYVRTEDGNEIVEFYLK